MSDIVTTYRNKVLHSLYVYTLKPLFFRIDPEVVHDQMTRVGIHLGHFSIMRKVVHTCFGYTHPMLAQNIDGIDFKNPIGLSAGFDKNAELTDILPSVGFGFAEVGSITGEVCAGNPKPRLWRLADSRSLVVYYGLKNDGCEVVRKRLKGKHFNIPIGISVAMTNCAQNLVIDSAIADFAKAFKGLESSGSYITVNMSCPNTQGGQPFVIPENLDRLLTTLDTIPTSRPVFVKISPDMDHLQIDALLEVIGKHRIHGIICTNLTKNRTNPHISDAHIPEKGGLSGKVVQDLTDDLLAYIYKKEGTRFVLVGCGGVFTAEDAYKKIRLGASLVQLITGMIFEGPQMVSEINRGLVELLKKDGFTHISQAVGVDNR